MKAEGAINVFVYGTLKPGGFYWPECCEGKVRSCQQARVRGRLYPLDAGYPALDASDVADTATSDQEESWVSGYVLTLTGPEVLEGFDQLEGYLEGRDPEANEYQRVRITAFTLPEGRALEVWTYVMDPRQIAKRKIGQAIPFRDGAG